jgi:ABC-type transport system involved in multi-copper enzyme maturation permease subunit
MLPIFVLTLRQLSGRWRLTIMSVLALLPVVVAVLMVSFEGAPTVREFEDAVLSGILAGAISPLVVLAIASAAFANEVEDSTLANLTLAPIPRCQIVVPKLLAAICVSGPFIAVSAFLTGYFAYSADFSSALAVTGAAIVGVALYSSAFVWLGLMTTRAIGYGLIYIVLWEGFFSGFVSGVRLFSVRYYSIAWMHGFDARRFAGFDDFGFGLAVAASVVVFGGFLLLTIRRLRYMDVP